MGAVKIFAFSLFFANLICISFVKSQSVSPTVNDGINCYACGLSDIDPEKDQVGSFADIRRTNKTVGKKMYNYTCDIADKIGLSDAWVRRCPHGTKSCFWAQGDYGVQVPVFRGCVETIYQFDSGCHRQLQSVDIVPGRSSANVEIYLCFCNAEKCNVSPSSAIAHLASLLVIAVTLIVVLLFFNSNCDA